MASKMDCPGALTGVAGAGNSSQDCGSLDVGKPTPSRLYPQAGSEPRRKPGEAEDDFPAVAACGRWRVVRSRDKTQFIVQARQAGSAKWPWRALAYVVNQSLLPGVLQRPSMGIPTGHLDRLLAAWRAR